MKTFEQVLQSLPALGWLTELEARLLWDTALAGEGDILEVGTYCGRSAVVLAQALRASPKRRLFCCDPFLAGFDGVDTPPAGQIFLSVTRSLLQGPTAIQTHICWQTEEELRRYWLDDHRLSLVYLDGDHSYAATLGALQRWAPLADVVALHDYGRSHAGVKKAVKAYKILSLVTAVGNLAVFKR